MLPWSSTLAGITGSVLAAKVSSLSRQPSRLAISSQRMKRSTQISGPFAAVTGAVNRCMEKAMAEPGTVVLVVKYLNVEKELDRAPTLTPDG